MLESPADITGITLRAVLEQAHAGFCILRAADLRAVWCNPAFYRFVPDALRSADLAGVTAADLIPDFLENGYGEAFRIVAETGRPFFNPEVEHREPGERTTWWRWSLVALPAPAGTATELLIQAVEVTDQVSARRESASAAAGHVAQLQAILGSTDEGIVVSDTAGNILYMNPAGRRILGFGPDEDVRRPVKDLASVFEIRHLDGRMIGADEGPLTRVIRGEAYSGYELLLRRLANGDKPVMVSFSGTMVRLSDGTSSSIVIGLRDITEQKQAEQELERARRQAESANASKDQFLAVLSHELRTPLTPVLTAVQMMEKDPATPESLLDTARMIRRNIELEARLIDDLLDLTRISRGKLRLEFSQADFHEKVEHVVQILEDDTRAKGVALGVSLNAKRHHVRGDPARLQQVVWNLLKNAIKFTPTGGEIMVATSDTEDGQLVLEVADTGIGIDSAMLPRIFDAFQQGSGEVTRQFGGLGLGLAVTKVLVSLHGGSIDAISEGPGKGATFLVRFPVIPEHSRSAAGSGLAHVAGSGLQNIVGSGLQNIAGSGLASVAGSGLAAVVGSGTARLAAGLRPSRKRQQKRILLVEDHEDTAQIMSMVLRHQGHAVRTAGTVAAALQAAAAEPFDLIISDIGLPDGSGLDLMRQLRIRKPVRGIALSGFGMEEDIRKSRAAGFEEHLTKPVSLDALEALINRMIGGKN